MRAFELEITYLRDGEKRVEHATTPDKGYNDTLALVPDVIKKYDFFSELKKIDLKEITEGISKSTTIVAYLMRHQRYQDIEDFLELTEGYFRDPDMLNDKINLFILEKELYAVI